MVYFHSVTLLLRGHRFPCPEDMSRGDMRDSGQAFLVLSFWWLEAEGPEAQEGRTPRWEALTSRL